jgi:DNA-binding GntR family transcriptional regulator
VTATVVKQPARQTDDWAAQGQLLVDLLAREIRSRVMDGIIPLGTWLRQEGLAKEFGVSRTPVREALQKLEAGGVVELVPYRGALVCGPTARQIRETYQVRAELEGLAAELAALRITSQELRRLRAAAELFGEIREAVESLTEPAGDAADEPQHRTRWQEANTEFHDIVHQASGNECLRTSVADLLQTFPRMLTWAPLRENHRLLAANIVEHDAILTAIEAGESQRARLTMKAHIQRAGELVADWFERQPVTGRTRPSDPIRLDAQR